MFCSRRRALEVALTRARSQGPLVIKTTAGALHPGGGLQLPPLWRPVRSGGGWGGGRRRGDGGERWRGVHCVSSKCYTALALQRWGGCRQQREREREGERGREREGEREILAAGRCRHPERSGTYCRFIEQSTAARTHLENLDGRMLAADGFDGALVFGITLKTPLCHLTITR